MGTDGGRWGQMIASNWFYARAERECDQRTKERSNSAHGVFSADLRGWFFLSQIFPENSTDNDKEKRPINFRRAKFSWLKRQRRRGEIRERKRK